MRTLADIFSTVVGGADGVRFEAFDGSTAGPEDAAVVVRLRSGRGLAQIVAAPGELGLARAYVDGELELDGDVHRAFAALDADGLRRRVTVSDVTTAVRALVRDGGLAALRPPAPPPEEIRLRGLLHSRHRDGDAISAHYDVSNDFYRIVLGPTMAYTCAVFEDDDMSLDDAQRNKFDLVCRKLELRPGDRLLDVGCGWGGMVLHAARHHGVRATGVTLSRRQAEFATAAIRDAGLERLAEVRHADYRSVQADEFDAVSSIGLTEHIGDAQLPSYARFLRSRLRPGGRLLLHAIMRPRSARARLSRRGFMNRYVFPDAEIEPLARIVSVLADSGLEVRHAEGFREHYARTLRGWVANLEADWDRAVAMAGANRARVWRLYMAGSAHLFRTDRMELHQVLSVRTDARGRSGMPWRLDFGRGDAAGAEGDGRALASAVSVPPRH